jgi:hypothetical protein
MLAMRDSEWSTGEPTAGKVGGFDAPLYTAPQQDCEQQHEPSSDWLKFIAYFSELWHITLMIYAALAVSFV